MRLTIRHATLYSYPEPVRESTSEVRLLPRPVPRQTVHQAELMVEPQVEIFHSTDYWGNSVAHFSLARPHTRLRIESRLVVETHAVFTPEIATEFTLQEFRRPTALTTLPPEPGDLGRSVADLHRRSPDARSFAAELTSLLHDALDYRTGTTTVDTTVAEVLAAGGGVCQDFAHLYISFCRSCGLPARYIGGYQFLGNEAATHENHAWAEVYIPGTGWMGWDPTIGAPVGEAHVQVTAGRDYADVSPIRGRYLGPPGNDLSVTLEMMAAQQQ